MHLDIERPLTAFSCGALVTTVQLLAGGAGEQVILAIGTACVIAGGFELLS